MDPLPDSRDYNMSDFLSNLRGPLDHVLEKLPTTTAALMMQGHETRERIQAARDAGVRPNATDVENLIGIMHVIKKRERAEDN